MEGNFNPLAVMAGHVTIAEVEEPVEPGDLDPDDVHLPGVFVQRVVSLTPDQAAATAVRLLGRHERATGRRHHQPLWRS